MPRAHVTLVILLWFAAGTLWLALDVWQIAALAVAIHLVEIPVAGVPRGIAAGRSVWESVWKTGVFGAVWWARLTSRRNRS